MHYVKHYESSTTRPSAADQETVIAVLNNLVGTFRNIIETIFLHGSQLSAKGGYFGFSEVVTLMCLETVSINALYQELRSQNLKTLMQFQFGFSKYFQQSIKGLFRRVLLLVTFLTITYILLSS